MTWRTAGVILAILAGTRAGRIRRILAAVSTIAGKLRYALPATLFVSGAAVGLAGVVWFVVGLVVSIVADPVEQPHSLIRLGALVGLFVALAGGAVGSLGENRLVERRWRDGRRRGTVTLSDLRPGSTHDASQSLTCHLEILVDGEDPRRGDHRTSVGPLDAPRLVDGARLPCQISPAVPNRVRVWIHADTAAPELTGRYLDFRPL
jgi:hypothetical protein